MVSNAGKYFKLKKKFILWQGYVKQQIGPIYSYIDKHNSIELNWIESNWFQVHYIFSAHVDMNSAYVWPSWLLSKNKHHLLQIHPFKWL